MKRFLLHIAFWLAYLVQDTVFAYVSDGVLLANYPVSTRIWIAIHVCVALLLIKILFTYLLLYGIIDRIQRQRGSLFLNIFYLLIALLLTLLLYRAIYTLYIFPVIYDGISKQQPFWRPTSFFFGLMDLGFVSGSAIVIRQIRQQFASKEKEKLLMKEKLEAELKFLKNQTNPHFLFNTLNNIYALARKRSEKTAEVVLKLSKILRFMLYESHREFISIGEEIKLIEDYIELERIRYSDRLQISFTKEIDDDQQPVSPFLLLPFVENAFKHGASESFYRSFIDIQMVLVAGRLTFIIANSREDGEEKSKEDGQIGLVNIRRQLELMYAEYEMKVENESDKFRVVLSINLNRYGKV